MPTYKYTPRRNVTNNIIPKPETTENKQENNNIENKPEENIIIKKEIEQTNNVEIKKTEEKRSYTPVSRNPISNYSKPVEEKPFNLTKTEEPKIETKVEKVIEELEDFDTPLTIENIKEIEEDLNNDDFFTMTQPTVEKKEKIKKTKPIKKASKNKKKIKISIKTIKKLAILVAVIGVMFFVVNALSNMFSSSTNSYTITNEHLKNRVVQGINPGELIDIKNSLPLQITAKDLVITDYTPKTEREIMLWDYTNTNLNKVNILVDGNIVKENIVLKKKPISLTIPAQCKLEVKITEEVSSEYMSYAIQVGNNTYFNKLSTARGNILYFTNPLNDQ